MRKPNMMRTGSPIPGFALLLAVTAIAAGCADNDAPQPTQPSFQAVSALGDTLRTPAMNDSLHRVFLSKEKQARKTYMAHPDSADALIWYGRRTAYLGNYREAIRIYTQGIGRHPEDPRLYRHRGHRYITTRQFDSAIADLERAAALIEGTDDQVEPDGLPNSKHRPRSTLHTNIWYHLGLAQYLKGRFEEAAHSFRNGLQASTNDDMTVAASYWLYMSLRRAGLDLRAGRILEPVEADMDIIENDSYHKLLLVFKGDFEEKTLLNDHDTPLDNATIGYGLGNWHYINGREGRAEELFRKVYDGTQWAAFGYIAAETDLARMQ